MEKEVIGILCADLHLRVKAPLCRTDDYWKAQEDKFIFILKLSMEYACPIYVAGDIFDEAKSSQFLEQWVIATIKENTTQEIYCIPGQHDLPNHNLDLYDKSSLRVVEAAECICVLCVPFNDIGYCTTDNGIKIGMMHTMVYKTNSIHEDVGGTKAAVLLRKHKDCNVLVTGDNHQSFTHKEGNRTLVNVGSMMRISADQINYKPAVFLLCEDSTIKKVPFQQCRVFLMFLGP